MANVYLIQNIMSFQYLVKTNLEDKRPTQIFHFFLRPLLRLEENIYLVHSIMNFLSKDIKESSSSQESLNQANNNLEDSIDRIFFFYLEQNIYSI